MTRTFKDWQAEMFQDEEFVEILNKTRGKRLAIECGIDIDQFNLFIHKYHSRNGKYVLFVFWFLVAFLCVEIRYHKKGTTPWLRAHND